LSESIITVIEK